jgi:hypothetical protein
MKREAERLGKRSKRYVLTPEEAEEARRLRASGRHGRMDPELISRTMGINCDAIRVAIGMRLRTKQRWSNSVYRTLNPFAHTLGQGRADPPEYVIADRDRRLALEHTTVTAAFFGDPLPGHSARDKPEQSEPKKDDPFRYANWDVPR